MPIDVASSIKFTATDTEPTSDKGRIYYDDSEAQLKHYDGSEWLRVYEADLDGTTEILAAESCSAISALGISDATEAGARWITAGGNQTAFQAWCDFSDGGWTLVFRDNKDSTSNLNTSDALSTYPTPDGANSKFSHAVIQQLADASSTVENPTKFEFADEDITRYINGGFTWTSSTDRNLGASWATTKTSTSYATRCGSDDDPNLNNGNGGEWASNSLSLPYQDGSCSRNGGWASSNPNGCGSGVNKGFCNFDGWSGSTGNSTTGWYKVNLWIGGGE